MRRVAVATVTQPWILTILILGSFSCCAVKRAEGIGCHLPDRPSFGLDYSATSAETSVLPDLDKTSLRSSDRQNHQVQPRQCPANSEETPRKASDRSDQAISSLSFEPRPQSSTRLDVEGEPIKSTLLRNRIERPPRTR